MSVKQNHSSAFRTYFCTFTCHNWISLFEITNSYDVIYKWFSVLQNHKVDIIGYVIMPNHLHCILHFNAEFFSVNKTIGNGKRFMAYELIKRLEKNNCDNVLEVLKNDCTQRDINKGQRHKVFMQSFDAKAIYSDYFMHQKLNYIHKNPVAGKWSLADHYINYEHSSASFYELGISKHFEVKHYKDL